jgi:hypothetical protein
MTWQYRKLFLIASMIVFLSLSLACGADALSPSQDQANLSLNGTAFEDENGDGFFSAGETGLPDVTIRLILEDREIDNATTDSSGQYVFSSLSPGRYELASDKVPGNNQTAPGGGYYEVTLSDKPGFGLDFGFFAPSNLTASRPAREYPLMHPTPEQANTWAGQYRDAAQTYLSPEIASKIATAPPASCNLLSLLKYTPSERDQGTCGNCWAWAGTGMMEMDYARQKGISDRFSIQYLDSSYNGGRGKNGACCGGWLDDLASFYKTKKIIVPWSNANAYYGDGTVGCGGRSAAAFTISTTPHYDLTAISTRTIPTHDLDRETAISNIKNVLLQNKAIWFAFFLPDASRWDEFKSFWGTEPGSEVWQPDLACGSTYSYSSGGGHAVLCVGYDDTDPGNRYWIMLNSWGTTAGRPDGLFRVNMDMNYDCQYPDIGYAYYWMTLDMRYGKDGNSAPQMPAKPQGPAVGAAGSPLGYTTSTTVPDGDTVRFTFDWGDGTTNQMGISSTGQESASHAWSKEGSYLIKVMATDSNGTESSWSEGLPITITAANQLPSSPAAPAGPEAGKAGSSYEFTSKSTDPDGDDVQLIFDWGDASQFNTTAFSRSGEPTSANHTWTEEGYYSVRAMAVDLKGGEAGWSDDHRIEITEIQNYPPEDPTAPVGIGRGLVGRSYSFAGYSTDPEGDNISYTFDWGDGESTESSLMTSGISVRASHAWSQPNTYEVRLMARDSNRAASGWSQPRKVIIKSIAVKSASVATSTAEESPVAKPCPCQDG